MVSALVTSSSPDRGVWARASWEKYFIHLYKWTPVNVILGVIRSNSERSSYVDFIELWQMTANFVLQTTVVFF